MGGVSIDPTLNYERCLALHPGVGDAIRTAVRACARFPVRSVICSGSIPLGGFIPHHSDIDLLAVTDVPPEGGNWLALMAELGAPPLGALLIEAGELGAKEPRAIRGLNPRREYGLHAIDLILLKKYSVVVHGEDVRGLIRDLREQDEIGPIIAHVRDVMVPAELGKLSTGGDVALAATDIVNVAHVMVRCLYTLRNGTLVSKPEALKWAIREGMSAPLAGLCRALLERLTADSPDPAQDRGIPGLFRDAVPAWLDAVREAPRVS